MIIGSWWTIQFFCSHRFLKTLVFFICYRVRYSSSLQLYSSSITREHRWFLGFVFQLQAFQKCIQCILFIFWKSQFLPFLRLTGSYVPRIKEQAFQETSSLLTHNTAHGLTVNTQTQKQATHLIDVRIDLLWMSAKLAAPICVRHYDAYQWWFSQDAVCGTGFCWGY